MNSQNTLSKPSTKLFLSLATGVLLLTLLHFNNLSTESTSRFLMQSQMHSDIHSLFQQWKASYSKAYSTDHEESLRFSIFAENHYKILSHNSQHTNTVLALNRFADLTPEEFAAFYASYSPSEQPEFQAGSFSVFEDSDLPSSVDWRQEGAVTPVKNQLSCGGCWAFAAAASLEGYNKIKNGELISLSEQQLIDCTTTCNGCGGCGNLYNALEYTASSGIESESDYPFTLKRKGCNYNSKKVVVKNQGYAAVQVNNTNQLKAALAQQPVIVGIEADQTVFQFYKAGVITHGCGSMLDHAVNAVGYGTFNGNDAFIVKNSWGPDWGMEGYVLISTNQNANGGAGVCGILSGPVYPTDA